MGFSEIGGVYVCDLPNTLTHVHRSVTFAVSFSGKFEFQCNDEVLSCRGMVIQPNVRRKLINSNGSCLAFIHIDPFSPIGMKIFNLKHAYSVLDSDQIRQVVKLLHTYFLTHTTLDEVTTTSLITDVVGELKLPVGQHKLDKRITSSIQLIKTSENITLTELALKSNLSVYRLSHLFKEQTGISFKAFRLHTKLVKALKAIFDHQSFSKSSYSGGFADQAHFNRTYMAAFGISPFRSLK